MELLNTIFDFAKDTESTKHYLAYCQTFTIIYIPAC